MYEAVQHAAGEGQLGAVSVASICVYVCMWVGGGVGGWPDSDCHNGDDTFRVGDDDGLSCGCEAQASTCIVIISYDT